MIGYLPNYYKNAFGRNVEPALNRLLKGGYLNTSVLEDNISLKTVPELKAILAEHKLKASGKKAELGYRLLDNLPEYELRELFPVGVYRITEKGREALKPYSIIFKNNTHSLGFSYYRLLKEREKYPDKTDEAILTRMLSDDLQKCYQTGDQSRAQDILLV